MLSQQRPQSGLGGNGLIVDCLKIDTSTVARTFCDA